MRIVVVKDSSGDASSPNALREDVQPLDAWEVMRATGMTAIMILKGVVLEQSDIIDIPPDGAVALRVI